MELRTGESWPEAGLVRLSRFGLLATAVGLVLLTGSLMLAVSQIDLDAWLFGHDLALKVGGTSLTLGQFRQLKELAPPTARRLSNTEFAAELVETLLLAEAGRQLRLDREEEFIRLREAFDQALASGPELPVADLAATSPGTWTALRSSESAVAGPERSTGPAAPPAGGWSEHRPSDAAAGPATPPTDLIRAWFLIEELARLTRARVADAAAPPAGSEPGEETDPGENAAPTRLHLQTIVVGDEATAREVLAQAAAGVPFPVLNASYSRSLYAPVGGDLGWKTAGDLPPGLFDTLAALPVGSMTVAYTDAEGVHLLRVKSRPADDRPGAARRAAAQAREEARRQAVQRFLHTMRTTMPWWVHPLLAPAAMPAPLGVTTHGASPTARP
ncbi:MAG: hypothetical protein OZSIB_2679 [Candidatus Ozemobacter sibiricus]|uniref:PpiC domain-containing protein n=1 Tax=Candidatus Ozemobacter sibiricus TaxID=2268124 RepID=A0A367ZTX9_9BACT|nr:MAG: hypothetical protein OZSIB_2679 [Candidatus Ozemobacter sibiricus]